MRVEAPDGADWRVHRRWLPWRPRRRRISREDVADAVGGLTPDDVGGLLVLLVVLGLAVLVLPVLLVGGLLALEVALVVLLLPLVTAGRAVLVGRWPVEVVRDGRVVHVESLRGWTASGHRVHELAEEVRRGRTSFGGVAPA